MVFALILLGGVSCIELAMYAPPLWQHARRALAAIVAVSIAVISGMLIASRPSLATGLLLLISLYRIFNLFRVVRGRMNQQYLWRVAIRTSLALLVLQALTLLLWAWAQAVLLTAAECWPVLAGIQLLVAAGLIITTARSLKSVRLQPPRSNLAAHELPSISVCIPARNETNDLENCLGSVIANDYPKLEVLVLDDQSHDRTPEIIRSFAHDGVRFIKGEEPPPHWLAKNWAYRRLFEEASGEIILFAGVDVNLGPQALRALVQVLLDNKAQMVCIMPANTARGRARSVLLQAARYAWELCLPRQLGQRPPVLSTCWAVKRSFIAELGDFSAVKRAITPESYFAKAALRQQGYCFLESNKMLDVTSGKQLSDQWDTAVRTRYPQVHRRPELVLLFSSAQASLLILPFLMLPISIILGDWLVTQLTAITCVLQAIIYAVVVRHTYRQFLWRSLLAMPVAVLLDIYIRHYSMWRYEFGQVIWKDRDVTFSVMHVEPHLPPME